VSSSADSDIGNNRFTSVVNDGVCIPSAPPHVWQEDHASRKLADMKLCIVNASPLLPVGSKLKKKTVASVRERIIATERPPLVGKISANFCGQRCVTKSPRRIPYDRNLGFLERSRCLFFQAAPQLYSRG
jgi:hypothetical protein